MLPGGNTRRSAGNGYRTGKPTVDCFFLLGLLSYPKEVITVAKLGAYIRSLRTEAGLTQAALAEMLHVTDKAVSKWERDLSYPDISLFPKLAGILGVTVSDLLKEWDDDGPPSRLMQYYRASHDIRTPIHIILGCADLVERYADNPEKRSRYLDGIRISGQFLMERCERLRNTAFQSETVMPEELTEYFRDGVERMMPPEYDFRGKRILIAEDMELNREIAREIIRQTGAEADFAFDGAECVAKIEQAPVGTYDMILMDVSMPNMDGVEATRRIRQMQEPGKAEIPIVAMTANVDDRSRQAALAAGMNGFEEKPIHIEKLYATMKEILSAGR